MGLIICCGYSFVTGLRSDVGYMITSSYRVLNTLEPITMDWCLRFSPRVCQLEPKSESLYLSQACCKD